MFEIMHEKREEEDLIYVKDGFLKVDSVAIYETSGHASIIHLENLDIDTKSGTWTFTTSHT